jgi:hypothetical protein
VCGAPIRTTLPHPMARRMHTFLSFDLSQAAFAAHLRRALLRHGVYVDSDPEDELAGDAFAWVIHRSHLYRGDALIFLLAADLLTHPDIAPAIETLRFYGEHQHMRILIVAVGPADLAPHPDLVHLEGPDLDYARARTLVRAFRKHDKHEPRRSQKKLTREELVVLKRMKWDVGNDPDLVGDVPSMAMASGLPAQVVTGVVHSLHERGLFRRHELCPATPTSEPEYWFVLTPRGESFVLPART